MVLLSIVNDVCNFSFLPEVIEEAFTMSRGGNVKSLIERVMDLVIRPRVLIDINAVTANVVYIPVDGSMVSDEDMFGFVMRVPRSVLGDTEIVEPLSLCSSMGSVVDSEFVDIATNIELIDSNTVYVHAYRSMGTYDSLKANVTYNDNLTELKRGSESYIRNMVFYAIGSYIYTRLTMRINTGKVYHGTELSVMKAKVEEFSDYEEKYQTFKEDYLRKILFMNKKENMINFTTAMFSKRL